MGPLATWVPRRRVAREQAVVVGVDPHPRPEVLGEAVGVGNIVSV
jgi:hypothetical protein